MNILDILYTLTIGPLKLIFEVIFSCANHVFNNPGLSIICLSFALNIILLPLYNRADAIQTKENETQLKLKDGVDHIKKSFKGDEQYMILQAYYRQNNYKPIYALRSLSSLLLQIPFFIAAASFLSNLELLNGTSFFFIKDLGSPDRLLFGLNLLPIAMTIINIINCIIYTKGQPLKSKIQLYLMALLFLILLYNSPSGLSFYYLLNNVFSLIKNVFLRLKNQKKALGILLVFVSICILLILKLVYFTLKIKIIIVLISLIILAIGFALVANINITKFGFANIELHKKDFLLCTVFLCLLMGIFIPSRVLNSSPEEFINIVTYENPVHYLVYSFALSFGLFVIWFNIYYSLMNSKVKKAMSVVICIICFTSVINYMFFGTNLGTMSNALVYDDGINFSQKEILINVIVTLFTIIVVYFAYKYKHKILTTFVIVCCCVFCLLSVTNTININKISNDANKRYQSLINDKDIPTLNFSTNGKNVVVLMLDRAISAYFPYIIDDNQIIKEQFSDFTYYPNTISFGAHTNFSTPSLFGGYEYTPIEINKRDSENLESKHNEALLVMPKIFSDNNYNVTVFDPPYAGYKEIPDISIYDDLTNVNAYITSGVFYKNEMLPTILKRNLFCYSFMKCFALPFQYVLYNDGLYLESNNIDSYYDSDFKKEFSTLQNLIKITNIVNDESNNCLIMQNSSTHENILLDDDTITYNAKLTNDLQKSHYFVNVSSLAEIGKWFDYLKENGVYDNTRIIICSDHSYCLNLFEDLVLGTSEDDDLMIYNPLLLVKDFNNKEYNVDETFMTLADIPYLVTEGIISDPTNPFTGNKIEKTNKNGDLFYIINSDNSSIRTNNGTVFNSSKWYSVHDDCRNIENWNSLDEPNKQD